MPELRRWRPAPRQWALLLFAGALAVRLAYVLQDHPVPPQDTSDYDDIALSLVRGDGFVARQNWHGYELRSWRPPAYPFFLAGLYGTFGYGHGPVRVAQAAIGAGIAVLVYSTGRVLCPPAALLAGGLASLYGPLVTSTNEVMSETLFTFLVVLAVRLLVAGPGRGAALSGGAAVGLAALTRPAGLLLWPVAVWVQGRRGRAGWRPALWITLGVGLALAPWTWRNYRVHGAFVPISTQGGFIVARSNAAVPDWRVEQGWKIPRSTFEETPSEVERDRRWRQEGVEYVRTHPGPYLRLVAERFLRFWYFLRPDYNYWFMVVLPFAVAGLWRFGHRQEYLLLTGFVALSVAVFSLLLYGSTRFRLPLEPLLILFAAASARQAWERWPGPRFWGVVGGVVGANLLTWWQAPALRELLLACLRGWGLK